MKEENITEAVRPSSVYVPVMLILGLGIGAVGFFYIDLLERKHRTIVECYYLEQDIRELNADQSHLSFELNSEIALNGLDQKIKDHGIPEPGSFYSSIELDLTELESHEMTSLTPVE